MTLSARAHARVGLLGNPSDLYGGKGLGFAVAELAATVELREGDANLVPEGILRGGWSLFEDVLRKRGIDPRSRPFAMAVSSDIPFQAGLSGSSALLIAAFRAWSRWFGIGASRLAIAELAWRTENEVLGIRAGPLDRLVQSHEGLVAMDFADPFAEGSLERIDPALLPPLLLAWHGQAGASSGDVHGPIHDRWRRGDETITRTMAALALNAVEGRDALEARSFERFRWCVDRNFDLRREVFPIAPEDEALIDLGRRCGAGAKFPGSGGAALFACRDEAHRSMVEAACREAGHATLRPTVALPTLRTRAVFLAAGFATRLHPITIDRAKPLLEIGGEPIMTRLLRQVESMGVVDDGLVVANHRFHRDFEAWRDHASPVLPIAVLDDGATSNDTRLGAVRDLAFALDRADDALGPAEDLDAWLVLACDNLFEFDLARMAEAFARRGRGQLVVREVPRPVPPGKYSEVMLASDGRLIARFREKPSAPESNLSAIAVYLLPRELPSLVRTYLDGGGEGDAPGHFLAWLANRAPLEAQRLEGRWLDIGSPEDLARADVSPHGVH
jgi:dTDP-glucose pyrophosphorylase/galactokinase/mevalonate kinase-like predicted kinase